MKASQNIVIKGAREHNLKGLELIIPKGQLVVFTGVSGSGKSSLAFDTLYAEGQRRYVESLSAYARQFLGQMDKPDYDRITGLSPTIAIEQKSAGTNPRSTVGTITEIYDYLRVLFARAGRQRCPGCGASVGGRSAAEIVDALLAWPEGLRFSLLAPVARQRKGEAQALLDELRKEGFVRVRVDNEVLLLDEAIVLDKNTRHDIDVVVDRLVVRQDLRPRLTDSVETALRVGKGVLTVVRGDAGEDVLFSERHYCAGCDRSFPELSPQLFSFNSPQGMCTDCNGLGTTMQVDITKLVPDPDLSLDQGALKPWANAVTGNSASGTWTQDILTAVCKRARINRTRPWRELSGSQQEVLLYGLDEPVTVVWQRSKGRKGRREMSFEGLAHTIARRFQETQSDAMRGLYLEYMSTAPCASCEGSRLREEARHVEVAGLSLVSLMATPIGDIVDRLKALELSPTQATVGEGLLKEVLTRVSFLCDVGLGYLSLDRKATTLSGGESQRIRLASQIGTELTGVIYVLDEPSIGLHQRDNAQLIAALGRLRDRGNSVIVVEHDEEMIRAADHLVDFGPGAGIEGGCIVASGTSEALIASPLSVTGAYLDGRMGIRTPRRRRQASGYLVVRGAREHNLKGIDVTVPLGVLSIVTGVSGAGKSTLVNDIIKTTLQAQLHGGTIRPGAHDAIEGVAQIDKVVSIDQRPIGRTPRSNPATYVKVFDGIRSVFASTREAKMYGYGPGRFSFNVKGGRCETCKGAGVVKVEMHFLADVYVRCDACEGRRFNAATLRITFKGHTIADVLEMNVAEARELFANHLKIRRILDTLHDVGLGYVALGQASTTLSGGEAQRIKLSRELARVHTGRTLYVLDEPTTGLHFADIARLLVVLERLVEAGNTVLVIEHNLDVMRCADHIIDLGPEGGPAGGHLVAEGSPEQVATVAESVTGRFLGEALVLAAAREDVGSAVSS